MAERIRLLDSLIANQIAAGEVVERPASVVKELLENSVDSKATRIQVDIENGGLQLIRVRDDGAGIVKEDLPLAISRHATSKVYKLQDLHNIVTLGFRGEALASIASVSKLTLTSMTQQDDTAWKIHVEGIAPKPVLEPASHPRGTTVEVRDIFFNTPVRRKFLRSEKTEYAYIEEVIKRMALSRFDRALVLRHNQRLALNLRSAVSEEEKDKRVEDICGAGFIRNALKVEFEHLGVRLWGWIAKPNYSRSQSDLQYFYVNGRMVKDKFLNHAVRAAFEENIFEGRYPCYVLYLVLNPEKVDVNVHPTKAEVRFQEGRLIHDFILHSLRSALNTTPENKPNYFVQTKVPAFAYEQKQEFVKEPLRVEETLATYAALKSYVDNPQESPEISQHHYLGEPITELWNEFILTKGLEGFQLISIPLASQRIVYGTLLHGWENKGLQGQPILFPVRITLLEKNLDALMTAKVFFEKLGIVFDALGPTLLIIKQLPEVLKQAHCETLFALLSTELLKNTPISENNIPGVLKFLAKTFSQNIKITLSKENMQTLLKDLAHVETFEFIDELPMAHKKLSREFLARMF